jgi:glycerate 2-kinase
MSCFSNAAALSSGSVTRAHSVDILNAGLSSVLTRPALLRLLRVDGDALVVGEHGRFALPNRAEGGRLFLISIGKAALDMAVAFESVVGAALIERGIAVGINEQSAGDAQLQRTVYHQGTHPLPSAANLRNTDALLALMHDIAPTERDLVVFLVSGGASALIERPRCSFEQLTAINRHLLRCGSDIHETNAVRKHLSTTKGGQLALRALPARVLSLIVSDVLGNDISVVSSGPTALDRTTLADVRRICEKYDIHTAVTGGAVGDVDEFMRQFGFAETPKDAALFDARVTNIVLLSNVVAVDAMCARARALGYAVESRGVLMRGEARQVGEQLASQVRAGVAIIGAGETTVTVRGSGRGGRNQELALGAVAHFAAPGVVASLGTDGADNGYVAGALVDNLTPADGAEEHLARNDSTTFFEQHAATSECRILVANASTGTNVADLFLALGQFGV